MKALVTGGGGFLGGAVARRLVERGDQVRSFARGDYPWLGRWGVEAVRGDLTDRDALIRATQGVDAVFHVAAKAGVWGPAREFYETNVVGTENVLAACRFHKIPRLIYTSTPSVVHDGGDATGLDETAPYAERFETAYPATKAQAEKMVLEAAGPDLATAALRPHLIWGPGDPNFLPRIVDRARRGRLRLVSGGPYLVDTVYIDNAARAHLLAADRLEPGSPVSGRAYFITQGEPIEIGRLINLILEAAGLPPADKRVPPKAAYAAGWLLEKLYSTFKVKEEPPLTRFVVRQLSTSHWFDISAARRDLGYEPAVSLEEGMRRLGEYFRSDEWKNTPLPGRH